MTKFFQNVKSTLLTFARRVFGFHLIEKRLHILSEDAKNSKEKIIEEIENSTALHVSICKDLAIICDRLELVFNNNKFHTLEIKLLNEKVVNLQKKLQADRESFLELNDRLNVFFDKNENHSSALDGLRNDVEKLEISLHHHLHNVKITASISARNFERKVRVCLFLVHHLNAWDSIADIYHEMLSSGDFHPLVAAIDSDFSKDVDFIGGSAVSVFLAKKNIPHFKWFGSDSYLFLDVLKSLSPDFIFLQSPWEADFPPAFRPNELAFSKLCYVPYFGMTLVEDFKFGEGEDLHFNQHLHRVAYVIFSESEEQRKLFQKYCAKSDVHVLNTGSAKMARLYHSRESVEFWPIATSGVKKLRMIWAPHHSVTNDWLAFGVFSKIYTEMLDLAKQSQDWLEVVLKPHPLLFANLIKFNLIKEADLGIWIDAWTGLDNCSLVNEGDYGPLFSGSDFMVTDGISFLVEYPVGSGKPLVFFERKDHLKLNDVGELAVQYSHVVNDFSELVNAVNLMRFGKLIVDPNIEKNLLDMCVDVDQSPVMKILNFFRHK